MIGKTNASSGGGQQINKSVVIITAPTGSKVTLTDNDKIKTTPEKNGTWTFTNIENGKWTVIASLNGKTTSKIISISEPNFYREYLNYYIMYGFRIDKNDANSDHSVIYTDQAVGMTPAKCNPSTGEFEPGSWTNDIFFRKNNHVWMVKSDGTPDYQLDDSDYSKKAGSGQSSDYANLDYDGNVMVRFDTIWLH